MTDKVRIDTVDAHKSNETYLARQAEFESNVRSYPRKLPLAITKAEGVWITDADNKEYLDCLAGAGTLALGHNHPDVLKSIQNVITSGLPLHTLDLTTPLKDAFSEYLLSLLPGQGKEYCLQFTGPSGADAVEAALKLARKDAHDKFGAHKSGIVAFKNAFHGRTLFTVSAGGQPSYSQDFAPLPPDIRHAAYNDLHSASELIDDTTCAVIVEPMQGEGGVMPAQKAFLQGLRELCDRHNAVLIFDEVQTGVGRTGELYAYMHYGVTPDVLSTAKALGGGFPVGAMLTTDKFASVMTVGTHGTTYGGNPLATAVAGQVLDIINTPEVLNGVKQRHQWFVERLTAINNQTGLFKEIRGLGLLIGCELAPEFAGKAKLISQEAAKQGVMVLIAGANVVRFAPALIVSEEEVRTGLDRFALACEQVKAGVSS